MLIHCFKMPCALGWGILLGTPRALESPALLQAGKQGPEGAQIAVIDLGNPLPGCAE